MKKYFRRTLQILLYTLILLTAALPVRAKGTKAQNNLQNVTLAPAAEGQWVKKGSSFRFRGQDGTYRKNEWISTAEGIFYLDKKGRRQKGWLKYGGSTYFLKKKTGAVRGWLEKGGKLYYFGEDAAMMTGLETVDGAQYYFSEKTGEAETGWVTVGRHQYYFDRQTHQMKKNCWVKSEKKHYYLNKKGRKKKSGWLKVGEKTYYLDDTGARVTGERYIDGKRCYFKKNGVYDPDADLGPEIDPSQPMVALTFDDGPGPHTERLLDCLEKNGAKATFFMVGTSVPKYSSTVKRMAEMGCELGSHSYSHPRLTLLSDGQIRQEASKTAGAIKKASGQEPTVFRLPYGEGASDGRVLKAIGLPSVYWSVDPRDWANTGNPQHTVSEVLNTVKNGDIVLMHDIHSSSVTAAETIIPALLRRGYQLVTVSQLANYKGKTTLKTGNTYRSF